MTTQEIITSTPDQFWQWWLGSSPYVRPGQKAEVDKWLLVSRAIKKNRLIQAAGNRSNQQHIPFLPMIEGNRCSNIRIPVDQFDVLPGEG